MFPSNGCCTVAYLRSGYDERLCGLVVRNSWLQSQRFRVWFPALIVAHVVKKLSLSSSQQPDTSLTWARWNSSTSDLPVLLTTVFISSGACRRVVGWGSMLPAGRLRVRFSMRSFGFSIYLILLAALGSTQPLTEMSTRNVPGGKGRPVRKADSLTAIC
jgi:hypothetical protein